MIKKILSCLLITYSLSIFSLTAEATETADFKDSLIIENYSDRLNGAGAGEIHAFQRFEPGFPKYHLLTLDGSMNAETAKFRELFLSPRYFKLLSETLDSAVEYRLYIRKELENYGIPEEIEYLPVVESYYRTTARSPSGALGMWQFMTNSVKPYLKLSEYVDERLDPWKETYAAIKKLQENYNRFKDWNLAIAAYNCGGGALSKAVNNCGKNDYWYLVENALIPEQTRHYNPKLIAISDIIINHEYYGVSLPDLNSEYENYLKKGTEDFEYITVNNAYRLSDLAKKMRIDTSILKELNPSFLKGYTPPDTKSEIRIPYGTLRSAEEALAKIDPINIPFQYKIKSGDTLWGLSRKYNVTVKEICDLNNMNENSVLTIGKILYIPSKLPR